MSYFKSLFYVYPFKLQAVYISYTSTMNKINEEEKVEKIKIFREKIPPRKVNKEIKELYTIFLNEVERRRKDGIISLIAKNYDRMLIESYEEVNTSQVLEEEKNKLVKKYFYPEIPFIEEKLFSYTLKSAKSAVEKNTNSMRILLEFSINGKSINNFIGKVDLRFYAEEII